MARKSKGVRCRYNRVHMEMALAAVKNGKLSIRAAAKQFSVPKSTLSDRVTGRVAEGCTPGKQTVFPLEVENDIAMKIKEAGRMGFGITRAQLCIKVGRLARAMKLKTPFRNGQPGKDWVDGFKRRHRDISLRSQTPLNSVRARMLNIEVTNRYFTDLGKIITDLNLHSSPQLIWNMDETNVSLTHKPTKVLAEAGQRNVPGRVGNCRDGITALACVNAAGRDIPPLVIVKGQTEKALRAYNVKLGPHGTKYTYQKKAWMEDTLGITWFNDHFLKHCGSERPQLMLLDSHSSHETLGLIELARANDISLFALPPHTTQYLNPLDKTVFGPFQREYNRQCTDFMSQSPNNLVSKWEWPRLFNVAYTKTVNKDNIMKGFEVCGIYPFNDKRIPISAFAPSLPFDTHTAASQSHNETPESPTATDTSNTNIVTAIPVALEMTADTIECHQHAAPYDSFYAAVPDQVLHDSTYPSAPNDLPPGAVVIATADENGTAAIDDPAVLLDLITTGQLEIIPSSANANLDVISWKDEVKKVFQLPAPIVQTTKPKTSKKLTSHRLLTSDEIYMQKKKEKEQKEKLEREKEERKLKRERKSAEKKQRDSIKTENKRSKRQ